MEKRRFKNNEYISLLGFGAMRLTLQKKGNDYEINKEIANELIDYAMEHGINYFDTAYGYLNGMSELFLGEALSRFSRDKYYLATKMPMHILKSEHDAEHIFNDQLNKCRVEYFDFYLVHNFNRSYWEIIEKYKVYELLKRKQKEGFIRYLGFSFHDAPELLKKTVETYRWDFAQIQLNYMDWKLQNAEEQYRILKEKDIPIVVMEPLRGGTLASLCEESAELLKSKEPVMSVASWAIRYAATFPNVITVLSGMSNMMQLKDNVATLENFVPLNEDDYEVLETALKIYQRTATIPCTGCGYCTICPRSIDIPSTFAIYNIFVRGGNGGNRDPKIEFLVRHNTVVKHDKQSHNCIKCNQCINHCPQHINIPYWLGIVDKLYNILANKKYDVAIAGMHYPNYGNILTAYAMYKVISDMGKSVLLLDRPLTSTNKPSKDFINVFKNNPYPDYALSEIFSDKNAMNELNDRIDIFLLPSDQVLRPMFLLGFDKYTLLDWVRDDKPKIAYASSFGTSSFEGDDNIKAEIGFFLSRFDAISVREDSGIKYAKDNFNLDVDQTLDPVFLCPPEIFHEMADNNKSRIPTESFIGSYLLHPTDQRSVFIDSLQLSLKLKNNCNIIAAEYTVDYGHTLWKKDFLEKAYVEELLACIKQSDYFITDSFHGVSFSIIFKKNFIVLYDDNLEAKSYARIYDLLNKLNLNERIFLSLDEQKGFNILKKDINYDEVYAILNAGIIRSKSWLNNALNVVALKKNNKSTSDKRIENFENENIFLNTIHNNFKEKTKTNKWLIRKTVGFFRCLKSNGFIYTIKLFFKKSKNFILKLSKPLFFVNKITKALNIPTGFDIPILFMIFNRLDTTKQVFEMIRKVSPKKLYIASDGHRDNREGEKEKVDMVRNYVLESIDWNCEVKTLFHENNLGCGKAVSEAITWFFKNEEMGIILEDDCLPSISFFSYCKVLLKKYKNNTRIYHISGFNPLNNSEIPHSYYFAQIQHCWGWASWRRAWNHYNFDISNLDNFITCNRTNKIFARSIDKDFWIDKFKKIENHEIDTWDYQWVYSILSNNGICINPSKNLVSNIGFGIEATHTTTSNSILENTERFEIVKIKHPKIIKINTRLVTDININIFGIT